MPHYWANSIGCVMHLGGTLCVMNIKVPLLTFLQKIKEYLVSI